jgi:hypothetical protein
VKEKDKTFLILAGAFTAFGLPFALAVPRTLGEKLLAVAALVALAAFLAAGIGALRRKK